MPFDTRNPRWTTVGNASQFSPSACIIFDPTLGSNGSGQFRPLEPRDFTQISGINVAIDDYITLSGNSQVGVTGTANVSVLNGNIALTGNPYVRVLDGNIAVTGNPSVNASNSNVAVTGTVTTQPTSTSSSPSNSAISGTNGVILQANSSRKAWFVQNLSTATSGLYVLMGTGVSATNFSFVLKAATASGDGGDYFDQGLYKGVVSASGANSQFVSWELV